MHKRFERDAERIKKKFLMYSKRSLANTEETITSLRSPTNRIASVIIEEKHEQEDGKTPSLIGHVSSHIGGDVNIVNLNVPQAQPTEQPSVLQTLEGQARLFYYQTKQKHHD